MRVNIQNKKSIVLSLLSAMAIGGAQYASAVPAKPGIMPVEQADGSVLNVQLRGDERSHFYLTEDNYLLSFKNDIFYYADVNENGEIIASDLRAKDIQSRTATDKAYLNKINMEQAFSRLSSRAEKARAQKAPQMPFAPSAGPGLFPGTHFPAMGDQKAIVILVEYKDVKMSLTDSYDYFNRMLNEEGFDDYNGTGSARDFFVESSMGQFTPQFDVFGPLTLSKNRSYYGGNDWMGNDQHPEEMVIEACQLLDDAVDFSEYDRDGDGYIDNVFVFYAGRGEASGGSSDTVWPHSWDISAATSVPYIFDGVRLDRYACSNEYEAGRPDGVGTFVHEFSHVMGLPDLYATSYTGAFTPGAWSALDYGPYNNDGCTPPLYGAFERYALGWMDPLPITGPLNATLHSIGTNQAGIIPTSKENEFFLLENRQQKSWDTYIPGHGMLIWHVDYNSSVWNSNTVNNSSSHQYVDIEEADGTQNDYSRAGDPFPGSSNKTSFTDDTKPSMKTWSNQRLELPITDIAETDGVITFKVCGGNDTPLIPVVAYEATEVGSESFIANWEDMGESVTYVLNVYTFDEENPDSDVKIYVPGYENRLVGPINYHLVEGLQPEVAYYYTVATSNGWEQSEPSEEIMVFTGRLPLTRRTVEAIEASEVGDDSFTARWLPLEDASGYAVTVFTKEYGAPIPSGCDFTDGVKLLPEGWYSTSGASYANASYSGLAAPSLRLSTSSDYLTTPEYDDYIRSLSFWHRGSNASADDTIVVSALVGADWQNIAEIPVVNEKGGVVTDVTEYLPEATVQVKIAYSRAGTKGAVAIDDIELGHGMTYTDVVVKDYEDYDVGDATECVISGLNKDVEYYYIVKAYDVDRLYSQASKVITVKTGSNSNNSAVADVASTSLEIAVAPSSLTISGAEGEMVMVTSVDGRILYNSVANDKVTLSATRGVYIVKSGRTAKRVLVP